MNRGWIRYVALGIVAYLVFLIATLPAKHAYGLVAPRLAPLTLYGVEGTVWSGRAAAVMVRGVQLESMAWNLELLPLLQGRIQAHLSFQTSGGTGNARVGRRLGGALYLGDVNTRIPVAQIAPLLPVRPVNIGGILDVKLRELTMGTAGIEKVLGTVDWKEGAVLAPKQVTLGDFSIAFVETKQGVEAQIRDSGSGPLEVKGTLRLGQDGSYEFRGALAARNSASPELSQALQFIGRPGPDGKIPVSYAGRLHTTGSPVPGVVRTTNLPQSPPSEEE